MGKVAIVKEQYCPKNHACPTLSACPTGAISQKDIFSAPTIKEEECIGCGLCARSCRAYEMVQIK
ncbi:MAG: 4Fe-4S binding protein [Bacteroidales bacterium]|jgi:Fe-S-cluster-containing hydrogenase component 2|nr:4Fe-4S binding protein [Bacteroidales bacterium]